MVKSRSWGHTLTPHDAERSGDAWCSNGKRCPGAFESEYHIGPRGGVAFAVCEGPAPDPRDTRKSWRGDVAWFWASWNYITGRAGRVSRMDRRYCKACAEKFAKNHGLTMPEWVAASQQDERANGR